MLKAEWGYYGPVLLELGVGGGMCNIFHKQIYLVCTKYIFVLSKLNL